MAKQVIRPQRVLLSPLRLTISEQQHCKSHAGMIEYIDIKDVVREE